MDTQTVTTRRPGDPQGGARRDDVVEDLLSRMTLREKVAQLCSTWIGVDSRTGEVAPHQGDMDNPVDLAEALRHGLGQLTRPFGTAPVDPAEGAAALEAAQRTVVAANRFAIPAMAHEECLSGFTTWKATCFPVPLSWGATFDPDLVREMGEHIGARMRSVGVHQGLAPVLDVTRDARWGRTEETIGEDPYLVGVLATAYVRGLQSTGVVATAKHFVGYSASRAARNLAPASVGPRELADVLLPPFEMAVVEGGIGSVMHAYNDVDGLPMAAHEQLLTGLLRDTWGFTGTVVADYFGIGFLRLLHGVAGTWGQAAALALRAGVDVEMPNITAYGEPLVQEVAAGRLEVTYVDRAVERVLRQKLALGLLEKDWDPRPSALGGVEGPKTEALGAATGTEPGSSGMGADTPTAAPGIPAVDLDPPQDRALARRIAERSVVLLRNDGLLPLTPAALAGRRIAVIGPCAHDPLAMLGCYAFPTHVGVNHPGLPLGVEIPTVLEALRAEFPGTDIRHAPGCDVREPGTGLLADAVAEAREADLVLAVLGDRAGLFGRGTSGEGCDAEDLSLPGSQGRLLEALLEVPTPLALVMLAGRPYALGRAPQCAAAIVQTFFPGEEGAPAIAGVLSGRVEPSGRLPVSVPAHPGAQPSTYLGPRLEHASRVSALDPTPAFPFGHGIGYTPVAWEADPDIGPLHMDTDGEVRFGLYLQAPEGADGVEVVQVYLHDPLASTVQPELRLVAFTRVEIPAGDRVRVEFTLPADVASYTDAAMRRIVESGDLVVHLARSSADLVASLPVQVTGPTRVLGLDRRRHCTVHLGRA